MLKNIFFALILILPLNLIAKTEFVVIIPSYNNEKFYEKNLESLLSQTYPHWTAIYVNDCSTDQTGTLVEQYLKIHDPEGKIKVIHNPKNVKGTANHYNNIHSVEGHKVIVSLDGDDQLAHPKVLKKLSRIYKDKNVWMTYGSYRSEPDSFCKVNKKIRKKVLKNNTIRKQNFITSHLKTFYAKLFHKIKKEDLMMNGEFFLAAADVAFMTPMLEMASKKHIRFVKKVLYIYNYTSPLNEGKVAFNLNDQVCKEIRKRKPYEPLDSLFD